MAGKGLFESSKRVHEYPNAISATPDPPDILPGIEPREPLDAVRGGSRSVSNYEQGQDWEVGQIAWQRSKSKWRVRETWTSSVNFVNENRRILTFLSLRRISMVHHLFRGKCTTSPNRESQTRAGRDQVLAERDLIRVQIQAATQAGPPFPRL